MTAALIWYAVITSACAGVAALAAETLLKQFGRPVRWAWVGALALSVALLLIAPIRQASKSVAADNAPGDAVVLSLPLNVVPELPNVSPVAATMLRVGWLVASGVLVLLLAGVHLRYRALRAHWPAAIIDGTEVRVSPGDGPAVMGFWRPDIVVPRWLLTRSAAEQRLAVTHEREHLAAGDSAVLTTATLAAILMPWNPAAWWMLSRLRLAVELDCDARVLRAGTLPLVYGNLLIDVAALSSARRLPTLALLNPPSNLQRRLIAMHPDRIRLPRVRGATLCAVAAVALLAACEAAVPTDATVASLDAAKAKRAAELMGGRIDSVVYIVDGKQVSGADADKIKAEEILRTKIAAGRLTNVKADTIEIDTKRALEERQAVLAERKAEGHAIKVDTMNVADRHGVLSRATNAPGQAMTNLDTFTGVLFVNSVEVPASRLKELNKLDIASVEVIKGPAAEQLYGARAKGGVIKIVTK